VDVGFGHVAFILIFHESGGVEAHAKIVKISTQKMPVNVLDGCRNILAFYYTNCSMKSNEMIYHNAE
jgi:hypothetical protein